MVGEFAPQIEVSLGHRGYQVGHEGASPVVLTPCNVSNVWHELWVEVECVRVDFLPLPERQRADFRDEPLHVALDLDVLFDVDQLRQFGGSRRRRIPKPQSN